MIKNIRYNKK